MRSTPVRAGRALAGLRQRRAMGRRLSSLPVAATRSTRAPRTLSRLLPRTLGRPAVVGRRHPDGSGRRAAQQRWLDSQHLRRAGCRIAISWCATTSGNLCRSAQRKWPSSRRISATPWRSCSPRRRRTRSLSEPEGPSPLVDLVMTDQLALWRGRAHWRGFPRWSSGGRRASADRAHWRQRRAARAY